MVIAKSMVSKRKNQLSWNLPKIKMYIECNAFANPRCQGFCEKAVSTFNIEVSEIPKLNLDILDL